MKSIKFPASLRKIAAFCNTFACASRIFAVVFFAAAVMLAVRPAAAQNTGSIYGSVQDSSGAVIPAAVVTATDSAHAITRAVKSNGSGEFTIPGLPIGTYTLTTTSPQFENSIITGIRVDANTDIKKVVKLVTGSTTASVTVVVPPASLPFTSFRKL